METKTAHFKVTYTETNPCEVEAHLTVPSDAVVALTEEVFNRIQSRAKIPGFRPGKATPELVRQSFAGTAKKDVAEELITQGMQHVLKEKPLDMVSYPRVKPFSFDFGKEFSFTLVFEKAPAFTVKSYAKMKLEKQEREVTPADIDTVLEELRKRNATLEPSEDSAVSAEHYAVVDYSAAVDGKPVPTLSATQQLVNVGARQAIQGFTDGLIGMKKDEVKTFPVTIPADFPDKTLAGNIPQLTVTLREIKRLKLPVLDDEFAKDVGVESLAALREQIRVHKAAEFTAQTGKELRDQISAQLLEQNTFAVPPSLVEQELTAMIDRAKQTLKRVQRMSEQDWQESIPALRDKYRADAEKHVRLYYILMQIIQQENISVTAEELAAEKERLKSQVRGAPDEFETHFEKNKEDVTAYLKEQKVFDLILARAKIKIKK